MLQCHFVYLALYDETYIIKWQILDDNISQAQTQIVQFATATISQIIKYSIDRKVISYYSDD